MLELCRAFCSFTFLQDGTTYLDNIFVTKGEQPAAIHMFGIIVAWVLLQNLVLYYLFSLS